MGAVLANGGRGLAALFLIIALIGCGDQSDPATIGDDPKAEPEPTAANFKLDADAACADARRELVNSTEFGGIAKTKQFAGVAMRVVHALRGRLAQLELPDRLRVDRARLTTELDVAFRQLGFVRDAARARDRDAMAGALAELDESFGEAARLMKLGECAAFSNAVVRNP